MRAVQPKVGAWVTLETSTMKKTMLNIVKAPGTPVTTGNVARTMGAAPLNPTHDTSNFARHTQVSPRYHRCCGARLPNLTLG